VPDNVKLKSCDVDVSPDSLLVKTKPKTVNPLDKMQGALLMI
jgi:hypothetical protein